MKIVLLLGVMGSTLLSCGETSDASDDDVLMITTTSADAGMDVLGGDAGSSDPVDDGAPNAEEGVVREAPQYDGECPSFTEGIHEGFVSAGVSRTFRVELPENPEGAPVVFAWHWLGGSANILVNVLGLVQLANDKGAIVIAPESDGSSLEWHFIEGPENNPDLQLFEDLLACASERHNVDLDRIYSTGHSAGGLWTSYLTIHASKYLAATAIMSGGADANSYSTPEHKLPVLVIWGGPSDTYSSFRFADSSQYLSTELKNDGHFVATCDHGGGHVPPTGAMNFIWAWFEDHPHSVEEPYIDGLPSVFPSYCSIP